MFVKRQLAASEHVKGLERISSRIAVRLRKDQPVTWSNGIGVNAARPVMHRTADVANFKPRVLPQFMLDSQVVLQAVGRPVAEILAYAGNS